MPVKKSGRKWKMGSGKAEYETKEDAEKAQRAYYAKKSKKGKK